MRRSIIIILTFLTTAYCSTGQTAFKTIRIPPDFDTLMSDKDLNADWIKLDKENAYNIFSLLDKPQALKDKDQFLESIIKLDVRDTKDLGFGLTYFECAQYGGYVTTWINLLSFEDKIIQYDINYTEKDFKIIDYLIRHDKKLKNEVSFVVDIVKPFSFYYQDKLAFIKFKEEVARKLGPIKLPIDNLDTLFHSNFSILTDPINSYYYGTYCYESSVEPEGRKAINYFIASNNIAAIREIIKGYNPEGRLYAIQALLIAANEGKTILTNNDKKLINDILSLNIPINSCSGCLVTKSRAEELLDERLMTLLSE